MSAQLFFMSFIMAGVEERRRAIAGEENTGVNPQSQDTHITS